MYPKPMVKRSKTTPSKKLSAMAAMPHLSSLVNTHLQCDLVEVTMTPVSRPWEFGQKAIVTCSRDADTSRDAVSTLGLNEDAGCCANRQHELPVLLHAGSTRLRRC